MSLSTRLRATAARLLDEYGESATWRSIVRAHSTATASTVETITEYDVKIAIRPEQQSYGAQDTSREKGILCYLAPTDAAGVALAFTPALGDRVVSISDEEFTVTFINVVRVQGEVAVYEVQLRR